MAKKAKKTARKAPVAKPPDVGGVMFPSRSKVMTLAARINANKAQATEASADNSELIRSAKERDGLHPGAFKAALKFYNLAKKDAAAQQSFQAHFDAYLDALDYDSLLNVQPTMIPRSEIGEKKVADARAKKRIAESKPEPEQLSADEEDGKVRIDIATPDWVERLPSGTSKN